MLINQATAQQQLFLSADPTLSRSSRTAQLLWLCNTEREGVTAGERGEIAHRDMSKEEARPGKKEEKYLSIGAEAQFKYRGAEGLDRPCVPISLGHQGSPNQGETAKKDNGEFGAL